MSCHNQKVNFPNSWNANANFHYFENYYVLGRSTHDSIRKKVDKYNGHFIDQHEKTNMYLYLQKD